MRAVYGVAVTERHARLAVEAFGRFGKGQPAELNWGDCFAYALAQTDMLDASASK